MKVLLTVIAGPNAGQTFSFDRRDRFLVGRSKKAQLCVSRDRYFSRHHFMIEVDPPNLHLLDLKSTNGTYVGSRKNRVEAAQLSDGEMIYGGDTTLRVSVSAAREDVGRDFGAPMGSVGPVPDIVRCDRCGDVAPGQAPRARRERVKFVCASCQDALRDSGALPEGYRRIRSLGRGAMGSVVLAEHEASGERRAIKLVVPNAAMSAARRALFLQQAQVQAELNHAFIVRVHEIIEAEGGVFFVVMDHVEGRGLDRALKDREKLSLGEVEHMAEQALDALEHAHGLGVVHRDLKPSNILVQADGSIQLADFGLARAYEESGASGFHQGDDDSDSVRYMAPEQILDFRNVGPQADLYALSAILHRASTGRHPLPFDGTEDPFIVVLEGEATPLLERLPSASPALARVIDRGLEKDLEKRFSTAREMRDALFGA